MHIEIRLDGNIYEGKETDALSAKEVANKIYASFGNAGKMLFELKDGSYLLLGDRALQSAAIIFKP